MDTWSSDSASQADRKYGESTEGRAAVLGARPRRSPASTCENSTKRRHSSSTLSRYWGPAGRWSFRRLACASEKHWEERSDWYHFPWLRHQFVKHGVRAFWHLADRAVCSNKYSYKWGDLWDATGLFGRQWTICQWSSCATCCIQYGPCGSADDETADAFDTALCAASYCSGDGCGWEGCWKGDEDHWEGIN